MFQIMTNMKRFIIISSLLFSACSSNAYISSVLLFRNEPAGEFAPDCLLFTKDYCVAYFPTTPETWVFYTYFEKEDSIFLQESFTLTNRDKIYHYSDSTADYLSSRRLLRGNDRLIESIVDPVGLPIHSVYHAVGNKNLKKKKKIPLRAISTFYILKE